MTLADRIRLVLASPPATFAKGGGGAKSAKGKGGKSSKKAKGVIQASAGGLCCKGPGGKFAPGNNYGSAGGARSSQKAAATRVKQRLASKAQTARADKAAAAAVGGPKGGIAGMVARSKGASAKAAQVKAARDKVALEKRQARNAKVREKRAASKEAAKPKERNPAIDRMVKASRAVKNRTDIEQADRLRLARVKAREETKKPSLREQADAARAAKDRGRDKDIGIIDRAQSLRHRLGDQIRYVKGAGKKKEIERLQKRMSKVGDIYRAAQDRYDAPRHAARKELQKVRDKADKLEAEKSARKSDRAGSIGRMVARSKEAAKAKAGVVEARAKAAKKIADKQKKANARPGRKEALARVSAALERGEKIPRAEVARQVREYRAYQLAGGTKAAKVNETARKVIREHAAAKVKAKPTSTPADRAASIKRMVEKSKEGAAAKAGKVRAIKAKGEKPITSTAERAAAAVVRAKRGSKSDRTAAAEQLRYRRERYQAAKKIDEDLSSYVRDPFKGRVRVENPKTAIGVYETKAKLDAARKKAKKEYGAPKVVKVAKTAKVARQKAAPPKPTSTPADRAGSIKRMTDRSRIASGKAGAENAARKRSKAAAAKGGQVKAARDKVALEKKQAKNKAVRDKRAAKKAEASPKVAAVKKAMSRATPERNARASELRENRIRADRVPQVASPLVTKGNLRFTSERGESLNGKGYAVPGLEGVRLVVVAPRGSKANSNKEGFTVYEATTGARIATSLDSKFHPTSAADALKNATAKIRGMGLDKFKSAIRGARKQASAKLAPAAKPIAAPKPTSTKSDRAATIKRLTDKSRVASGKAGAENAARKRAKAAAGSVAAGADLKKRMQRLSPIERQGFARDIDAARAASASGGVKPVTPPPPAVERRPISDPVRIKAESSKMDEAFRKAPGGGRDNFVTLADLHKTMPHLSREEFVAVVNKGRDEGKYTLDSAEGRVKTPPGAREAAIVERGEELVYISRRRS